MQVLLLVQVGGFPYNMAPVMGGSRLRQRSLLEHLCLALGKVGLARGLSLNNVYQHLSMFINIDSQHFFVMLLVEVPTACQGLPLTVFALVLQVELLGCPQKWLPERDGGMRGFPCPHFHLLRLGRLVWNWGLRGYGGFSLSLALGGLVGCWMEWRGRGPFVEGLNVVP